jgi:hypothetical protein
MITHMPKNTEVAACRLPFAIVDVGARLASARRIAHAALALDGVLDPDRRAVLRMALWRMTEFERYDTFTYGIQYRTEAVVHGPPAHINHEHVVPLAWLLDQLAAHPDRADAVLDLAVSCVVTVGEHNRDLQRKGAGRFGWDRYRAAGLVVIDAAAPGMPPISTRSSPHRNATSPSSAQATVDCWLALVRRSTASRAHTEMSAKPACVVPLSLV